MVMRRPVAVISKIMDPRRGSGNMPSSIRSWLLAGLALSTTLGSGPIASAQGPSPVESVVPKGDEVYNKLPGLTTILYIRPDGSLVKKGDLVCELDPAALKEKLAGQETATKGLETAYQQAKTPRQAAELALEEFLKGTFKQEQDAIQNRIAVTEVELKQAEDRLVRSRRHVDQGIVPKEQAVTHQIAVQRLKLRLEQARTKRQTLEKYTKDKMTKKFQSEIEKARADELAKQAAYSLAQTAQERLQKQIESCRVLAPSNGRLRHSDPIEEAADVREGQLLFRVVPEGDPKDGAK
jgi:multidrug resistance efflux pump